MKLPVMSHVARKRHCAAVAEAVINFALGLPALRFDHRHAPSGAWSAFDFDGSGMWAGHFYKGVHGRF